MEDMQTIQTTCGNCGGRGYTIDWFVTLGVYNTDGFHKMQSEQVTCKNCDGKGYTEYVVFSPEEAKTILKHCGLSIEG